MTPQLPTPGGDDGTWGNILNTFLSVAHNPDGSLQTSAITAAGGYILPGGGIPSTDMSANVQTSLELASSSVQLGGDLSGSSTAPTLSKLQGTTVNASVPANNQVLTFSSTSNAWVPGTVTSSTVNDATTTSKGIVELSGDLGGTASSPSVLKLNGISISGTPATNQVLTATSTTSAQWTTPVSSSSTLASDSDVTITGPTTNQVLAYNGTLSKWQNATLTESDVTNLTSDLATRIQLGGDVAGTTSSPKVVSLNGGITLPGTAPSATGQVLTTTGTGASATTAWATPAAGLTLDTTASDIQPNTTTGSPVAGSTGKAADAGHQHVLVAHNHTTTNLGGQIPVGGISATGTASSTTYLRGDGSWNTPSTNASSIDGVTVSGTPSSGQVITASSGTTASWSTPSSAPVSSVFGRTGPVVATSGDYTAAQVGALPSTDDLSAIASSNPTAGNVSMNSHKITNLTNGASAQDAAAFGQIPVAGSGITNTSGTWSVTGAAPTGTASGDLSGTYPGPTVARVNGVSVSGTPTSGQVLTATSGTAASWQALDGTLGWLNVVVQYGADPTGTNDSTTAIQNAITAAINANGGVVYLPSGTYKVAGNLSAVISGRPIYITGDGWDSTIITFTGSGDCFRIYCPTLYNTGNIYGQISTGGGIAGLTIDGTNHTGAGASGVHIGDVYQYEIDVYVQNFTAASDKGIHFDNQYYWAEQMHGKVFTAACTAGVVFDVSGTSTATGSYDRADLSIYISQENPAFDGVVFQNGAVMTNGRLFIVGNCNASSSPVTSALLRITGSIPSGHPGAGGNSGILNGSLVIGVECTASTYAPQTIVYGSAGNFIENCNGVIDFGSAGNNFTASNAIGTFSFVGPVLGDSALLASLWTPVYGGFPTGWTGSVKYRLIGNGDLAIVKWSLSASVGTAITVNEAVTTLPSGFYYPSDTTYLAGNISGGGQTNATAFMRIGSNGAAIYEGPAFTVTGGAAYWYGQGVFSNIV